MTNRQSVLHYQTMCARTGRCADGAAGGIAGGGDCAGGVGFVAMGSAGGNCGGGRFKSMAECVGVAKTVWLFPAMGCALPESVTDFGTTKTYHILTSLTAGFSDASVLEPAGVSSSPLGRAPLSVCGELDFGRAGDFEGCRGAEAGGCDGRREDPALSIRDERAERLAAFASAVRAVRARRTGSRYAQGRSLEKWQ